MVCFIKRDKICEGSGLMWVNSLYAGFMSCVKNLHHTVLFKNHHFIILFLHLLAIGLFYCFFLRISLNLIKFIKFRFDEVQGKKTNSLFAGNKLSLL